jgi:hypothetical protein
MGFVAHAASEGMASEGVETFLSAYADRVGLSAAEVARFERVGRLLDVEWIAVYASAITAPVVEAKRFADPNFELQAYLEAAIARLRRRLGRATEGAGYRFQA